MQIALYKGTSFISRLIRWFTRSQYSHAAFLLDVPAGAALLRMQARGERMGKLKGHTAGSVIEAWQGGVKISKSLSTLHTPGTNVDVCSYLSPLSANEEEKLLRFLKGDIGLDYDYWDIVCFVTRQRGSPGRRRFCSLLVTMRSADVHRPLFRKTEPWRVPPDWLGRTRMLKDEYSTVTT